MNICGLPSEWGILENKPKYFGRHLKECFLHVDTRETMVTPHSHLETNSKVIYGDRLKMTGYFEHNLFNIFLKLGQTFWNHF